MTGAATAGDVLGTYLRSQATTFLRALRVHEEGAVEAAQVPRKGARRRAACGGPRAASPPP